MAEITLADLLEKSLDSLRKQVINPFSEPTPEPTSPVLADALKTLQKVLNKHPQIENSVREQATEELGMLSLKHELIERKNRTRDTPYGLEPIGNPVAPDGKPINEAPDDPGLGGGARHPIFKSLEQNSAPSLNDIGTEYDGSVSLGGFSEDRDTTDEMYREKAGLKPRQHDRIPDSMLHGIDGRDTPEDVYRDKHSVIATQEYDDDDLDDYLEPIPVKEKEENMHTIAIQPPENIGEKVFATTDRNNFKGLGTIGKDLVGSTIEGLDGIAYVIVSLSEANNGVQLRRADNGYKVRTPYTKFFGLDTKSFQFEKGDIVSYYDSKTMKNVAYTIVGLNPASNNVQLLMDGKKKFIRATKVKLIRKAEIS